MSNNKREMRKVQSAAENLMNVSAHYKESSNEEVRELANALYELAESLESASRSLEHTIE
ncbi:hypothetical protein [Alloscardovia omnicolens]